MDKELLERTDYQRMKDAELIALCAERDLIVDGKNRGDMIQALKQQDLDKGEGQPQEMDEEGKLQDVEEKPKEEVIKVIFHSRDEHDIPYVYLSVNGRSFYIPKEREVVIPKFLLKSAVKDAVEFRMEPIKEGDKIRYRVKKVHRFPYTVVDL